MNPNIYEEAVTPPLTPEQELAKAKEIEIAKANKHQRIQLIADWMKHPFSQQIIVDMNKKISQLTIDAAQLSAGGHPSNELIRAKNVELYSWILLSQYLNGTNSEL